MKNVMIRLRNIPDYVDSEKVREYVEATVRKFVKNYPVTTPPEVVADKLPDFASGGYIPRAPGTLPRVDERIYPWTPMPRPTWDGTSPRVGDFGPFPGTYTLPTTGTSHTVWSVNADGETKPAELKVRNHPFDGLEVNDDQPVDPEPGEFRGLNVEGVLGTARLIPRGGIPIDADLGQKLANALSEDFPQLSELFRAKRENPQPPGEGDWQLRDDDKVGED